MELWSRCGLVNVVGRWVDAVFDGLRGEEGVQRYPSCSRGLVWVIVVTMVMKVTVVMVMAMARAVVPLPPDSAIGNFDRGRRHRDQPFLHRGFVDWGFDGRRFDDSLDVFSYV